MVVTSVLTRNYNENPTLDTWSKQTQTKPILPAYMAGKIALSEVKGPVVSYFEIDYISYLQGRRMVTVVPLAGLLVMESEPPFNWMSRAA
jgi:hypothetical protein